MIVIIGILLFRFFLRGAFKHMYLRFLQRKLILTNTQRYVEPIVILAYLHQQFAVLLSIRSKRLWVHTHHLVLVEEEMSCVHGVCNKPRAFQLLQPQCRIDGDTVVRVLRFPVHIVVYGFGVYFRILILWNNIYLVVKAFTISLP